MKTALAWLIRITGLVIGTLFWTAVVVFVAIAVWHNWTQAVTTHGIDRVVEKIGRAAFWSVFALLILFLAAGAWDWAKNRLDR